MRLLLTRPEPENAASAARLRALGHEVILSPVSSIVTLAALWPEGKFDGLLATSARAFATFEPTVPSNVPPLFVAGTQTMLAAQQWLGKAAESTAVTAPDAANLARILVARQKSRWLYLAGRDRKPYLENALAAAGHETVTVETYAAQAAPALTEAARLAMLSRDIDAVLHYSRRSAGIFVNLANKLALDAHLMDTWHFCLSQDVAEPLLAAGAKRVRCAATPGEASLFALLDAGGTS